MAWAGLRHVLCNIRSHPNRPQHFLEPGCPQVCLRLGQRHLVEAAHASLAPGAQLLAEQLQQGVQLAQVCRACVCWAVARDPVAHPAHVSVCVLSFPFTVCQAPCGLTPCGVAT